MTPTPETTQPREPEAERPTAHSAMQEALRRYPHAADAIAFWSGAMPVALASAGKPGADATFSNALIDYIEKTPGTKPLPARPTPAQAEAWDVAEAEIDVEGLSKLYADVPPAPYLVINNAAGFELRQADTDPTNKHHWPFRIAQTIAGQRTGCDEAVFNFLCGVLNAWPEIERRLASTSGAGVPDELRALSEKATPGRARFIIESVPIGDTGDQDLPGVLRLGSVEVAQLHERYSPRAEQYEDDGKFVAAAVNFARDRIAAAETEAER